MQKFSQCGYTVGPGGDSGVIGRMVRRATRPGSEASLDRLSENRSLQTKLRKSAVHIPRMRVNLEFSHDHPFLHVFIRHMRELVKGNLGLRGEKQVPRCACLRQASSG